LARVAPRHPFHWFGTIGYMAPEQLRGGEVDVRADVFAVGVMVIEALTGRRPFHQILQRCMARNPQERYGAVADLRRDLIPVLGSNRVAPDGGVRSEVGALS
jgi:serine/threonine protein kinase